MDIHRNTLTQAGLVKMPFVASNSLGKLRLYVALNQEPEVIATIQTLFEFEIKGIIYEGIISEMMTSIRMNPYLLKEGKNLRLISSMEAFGVYNRLVPSRQEEIKAFYEQALKVVLKFQDLSSEGNIYNHLGNGYQAYGDYTSSIMYYEKMLEIALRLRDQKSVGWAYGNLGVACEKLKEYTKATTYHDKALKIFLDFNNQKDEGRTYHHLGNAYEGLKDYTKAMTYHQKALTIALELNDQEGEGLSYGHLGIHSEREGDYRGAIAYYEKELKLFSHLQHQKYKGLSYGHLGSAYHLLGEYGQAIMYHEKALKVALEFEDQEEIGSCYSQLACSYHGAGDYGRALAYHEKGIDKILGLNNLDLEESGYGNLGITYHGLGDYNSAIASHQKQLERALKLGDRKKQERAYGSLGTAYDGLRDYQRAIAFHEKALEIALERKDPIGEAKSYGNLGNAYDGLRDYNHALAYHKKDLKISLELKDSVAIRNGYHNLGNAYHGIQNYNSAITCYKKVLGIALEMKDLVDEGKIYGNLGIAYQCIQDAFHSEHYFRKGITLSALIHNQVKEAKWQISLFEEWSVPYLGLERLLLLLGRDDEALEISDQRRSRALCSLIVSKRVSKDNQTHLLDHVAIQKMQELARKCHATFIIYSLALLEHQQPFIQAWVISSTTTKIESIKLFLSDDESLNPEHIFKAFPYPVETRRPKRGEKQPSVIFKEKLSSWYTSLIAPLEQYLPKKDSGETLTFIPDGFLAHLPFGAFYNERQDQYLIENYPVSIAPSMRVLSLLDQLPKNESNKVLLMGNPTTVAKKLDALEFAEKEVSRVLAPLLGVSQDEVFIQERATPRCALTQAPTAHIVHIACHGVAHQKPLEKPDPHSVFEGLFKLAIDDDHPLGHLHAADIALMSLKADLVFMSACHLGRGLLKREGSIGPIWSFLGAGAKSTVASYWPLPDGQITVKMVEEFYKHYLGIGTSKLSKATALQQAALLAMKTERDQPRQWGAFFLSGLAK
ncbi:MAG: CHAT domain-containing protein [Candidatus Rhabdochlamydia sp.]